MIQEEEEVCKKCRIAGNNLEKPAGTFRDEVATSIQAAFLMWSSSVRQDSSSLLACGHPAPRGNRNYDVGITVINAEHQDASTCLQLTLKGWCCAFVPEARGPDGGKQEGRRGGGVIQGARNPIDQRACNVDTWVKMYVYRSRVSPSSSAVELMSTNMLSSSMPK